MKHIKDLSCFIRRDRLTKYFLIIQVLNYGIFLALDLMGEGSHVSILIKFILVLICFFYVSIRPSVSLLWKAALFFTVLADVFLLVLNDYYIFGVLAFIIVQQLYGIYLSFWKLFVRIFVIGALTAITSFVLYVKGITVDGLLICSIFYFFSILGNFFVAYGVAKRYPQKVESFLFALGLMLFLLCDINVGLYNISSYINISDNILIYIKGASSILMWTFYAPSQVLISLSAVYNHYNTEAIRNNNGKSLKSL